MGPVDALALLWFASNFAFERWPISTSAEYYCLVKQRLPRARALSEWYDFRASLELVQIIRPLLHHLASFRKVRCAVVCASVGVAHGVGKLVFNVIGTHAQHFIENGSRHSSE